MKQYLLLLAFFLYSSHTLISQKNSILEIRNEKASFNFNAGLGFMLPKVVYTKDGYENSIQPRVSLLNDYGIELEYNLNKNLSIYSGFLLHKKSYKLGFNSGGTSTVYAYSYTLPIFLRYNFSEYNNSTYVSLGSYYNIERDEQFLSSFGVIDGIQAVKKRPISYNNTTIGLEIGKRFSIRKANFSASIHYMYSWQPSFEAELIDLAVEDINDQNFGYATSNGSALGLRLKYHFGLFQKENSASKESSKTEKEKTFYNNYFNVDILGESLFYGLSYERFLFRKNWVHFSLKAGISYIPEYDDGSFTSNIDATRTMGLFIPTSINLYFGKTNSFIRFGQAIIPTYSPYYYPELHDRDYGWNTFFVSILGYRYEYKKWAVNAHFNFQFTSPVPYGGFSIARAF